jgi:putative transcriptional regulator
MPEDRYRPLAAEYALGALDEAERTAFRSHAEGCAECRAEADAVVAVFARLADGGTVEPARVLREHVLEMAEAPQMPVDLTAYAWDEPIPGIKMHTLREDPERGIRTVLVWASPGARVPPHRHLGDEEILILQGFLRDHRGVYGPGDICRSRTGFVHSEEVPSGEDCICYVVYHGGHEPVSE